MNTYNRNWIGRIWEQRSKAKNNSRYDLKKFKYCLKATIALFFNSWEKDSKLPKHLCEDFDGWYAVAYQRLGTYYTDYGTGNSFATLVVKGFKLAEYEDGDL